MENGEEERGRGRLGGEKERRRRRRNVRRKSEEEGRGVG